jgi:hypothetical protein
MSIEELIDERVRAIVRTELAPPVFCNQRNVETVAGLPRREFLRLARARAFPTTRERRLVIARTVDVLAYVERQIALREALPQNDADPEALALARVGARRVGGGR